MNVSFQLQNELRQKQGWESRLDLLESKLPDDLIYGKKNIRIMIDYLYHKYKGLDNYHFHLEQKLDVNAVIIIAKKKVFPVPTDIGLKAVSIVCNITVYIFFCHDFHQLQTDSLD